MNGFVGILNWNNQKEKKMKNILFISKSNNIFLALA